MSAETFRRWVTCSILPLLCLAGCATNPFPPVERVDMREVDAQAVPLRFDAAVHKDFEVLQSVTIRFLGRAVSGLGYLSVSNRDRSFSLNCMTPMGVNLLTVIKDPNGIQTEFSFTEEMNKPEVMEAIATDISRIYFDWVPSEPNQVKRYRHRFCYTQKGPGKKRVRYTFGGPGHHLLEKRYWRRGFQNAVVHYYDFRESEGKLYPMGIFLKNSRYHYSLIIKTKEFHGSKDPLESKG